MTVTEAYSYLRTSARTIANIDAMQVRMMLDSLRRLRHRNGTLHVASSRPTRHITDAFTSTGLPSRIYTGETVLTGDGLLILAEHRDPPLTERTPTTYAIVTATGGDVAQHVSYCVVIPTFLTSHVEGAEAVVIGCLVEGLRCGSS